MANMQTLRRRMMIIVGILLVLDIAAVGVLLSPIGRSRDARIQEYDRVRGQLQAKRNEALPARDMDKKLATARTEIDQFYKDRVPARYSDITDALGKLAKDSKVQLGGVSYKAKDSDLPGLQRIDIEANVAGDYASDMRFINGLEREKMLFVLNAVNLGEAQGGNVKLQMKLETYMRTGQ